jgi:hypothetical protein
MRRLKALAIFCCLSTTLSCGSDPTNPGSVSDAQTDVSYDQTDLAGSDTIDLTGPDWSDRTGEPDNTEITDVPWDWPAEVDLSDASDFDSDEEDLESVDSSEDSVDIEADLEEPFPWGEECEQTDDCDGGICLETKLASICTKPCDDDCPVGWECWDTGQESLCVPPYALYCNPCDPAIPPAISGLSCVPLNDTSVLLIPCPDETECPFELDCFEDDNKATWCEPPSGTCECLPGDTDKDMICDITNEWGTCVGWQPCLGSAGLGDCVGKDPAQETCNNSDDDCDGLIDESWSDCAPRFCLQDGLTFFLKEAENCLDGGCVPPSATAPCGLYGCNQIGPFGECLTTCQTNDDCVIFAFCEANACLETYPDGSLCESDSQCLSSHCIGSTCCASGDCCTSAADCPADWWLTPVCDDPEVCQGHRRDALCINSMCQQGPNLPDDSGCGDKTLADDCDPFPAVYCNGLSKQQAPACSNSCFTDDDCAAGSHCDQVCKSDLADGLSCDEDSDCQSSHCDNGLCCLEGWCCTTIEDCLDLYVTPPTCDSPESCQGHRVDAFCTDNICLSSALIDDDSACSASLLATSCEDLQDQYCNGDQTQSAPQCETECTQENNCDSGFTCKTGACIAKVINGQPCEDDGDCLSSHCGNGSCCGAGDCCGEVADCPEEYWTAPYCADEAECQGYRVDADCDNHTCSSIGPINDDRGCDEAVLAVSCAPYPEINCKGTPAQLAPSCASSCQEDEDCAEEAHCDETCHDDLPDGYSCDEDSDCISAHCSNGVCCEDGYSCCLETEDCPAGFSVLPVCEFTESCQGYRVDATCLDYKCGSTDLISDDSGCNQEILAQECAPFLDVLCSGKVTQAAPQCPKFCGSDDHCLAGFHCDSQCLPNQEDGTVCDENTDCASDHCSNGLCCLEGTCCVNPSDCPMVFSQSAVCEAANECRGQRVDASCDSFICGSNDVDDDTACGLWYSLDDCGPYPATTCDGSADQTVPDCPTDCATDNACDADAHCDGTCIYDLPDGEPCDEKTDCISGHCQNGFCCQSGDCCQNPGQCPEKFTTPPNCDTAADCQGSRVDATCNNAICGSATVDDDSACTKLVLADDCGPNPDLFCSGEPAQSKPECSAVCAVDDECGADYHCDVTCQPDVKDGLSCDEDSDCLSHHCQNAFCCSHGDCCQFNYHCPEDYISPAVCEKPEACQGSRQDRVCSDFVCTSQKADDDSVCTDDNPAQTCGPYLDLYCNGKTWQAPPICPAGCSNDAACEETFHCDGTCTADLANGQGCDEQSDCISNYCSNGFCTTAGTGCVVLADCPDEFSSPATCSSAATCQGTRTDATCLDFQCGFAVVDDDSACLAATLAQPCGLFSDIHCNGQAIQSAQSCPMVCQTDGECDDGAHCDDDCIANVATGSACDEHSDCQSQHCTNDFCCGSGDCCQDAGDCPDSYSLSAICGNATTCQGQRSDAVCTQNTCATIAVADDSACTADLVASDCGAFLPVFCSGAEEQTQPQCPATCADDNDCDAGGHCDTICLGDLQDGTYCNEDSDCSSGHCQGGICCSGGHCCLTPAACPGQYKAYPTCQDDTTCQGTRIDATCTSNVCGSTEVDDDSGCGWWTLADGCGQFAGIYCNGSDVQETPGCPLTCNGDGDCDPQAHCDGSCVADQDAGTTCDEHSDCQSGNCANGFCCSTGDCCINSSDCPDIYSSPSQCGLPQQCQGERIDAVCLNFSCSSVFTPDDTACSQKVQATSCGMYLPRFCTGAENQLSPTCPGGCFDDNECLDDAHCDGTCLADLIDGANCDEASDCQSAHCLNDFCCASGDCCFLASHCPDNFSAAPSCTEADDCQGERTDATCSEFICGSIKVNDDSACSQATVSDDCGPYKPVYCNGKVEQLAPNCPSICTYDFQCDPGASCINNQCQP